MHVHRGIHRPPDGGVGDEEADSGGGEEDDGGEAVGTEQAHASAFWLCGGRRGFATGRRRVADEDADQTSRHTTTHRNA
ncbi:hypothetical protein GCM10009806_18880 [Microbacterium flavum]